MPFSDYKSQRRDAHKKKKEQIRGQEKKKKTEGEKT
jgi:hypothetical protein